MRLREYIRWKAVTLCFIGIGLVLLGTFLLLLDSHWHQILVAELLALLLTVFWLLWGYFQDRSRLRMLERIVRELEEPHLLGEVLPRPASSMERKYYDVMKAVSRSAIGEVEDARWEAEAYRDYVERWVHEIKTPLTACSLILDNDGDVRKLRRELKRADNLTESILYYARMATIEKDTRIRRVSVAEIMENAVKSQMEILIGAGISIEAAGDFQVHTDDKSLLFILKQLLINCGKYCPGGHVVMKAEGGRITVEDNGPGIPSHELRRVTDRGFSGANGRASGTSTGMGLYIVKELCRQLEIDLEIQSEAGAYTRVLLSFGKEAEDVVY